MDICVVVGDVGSKTTFIAKIKKIGAPIKRPLANE
jgi:hypothetical protein